MSLKKKISIFIVLGLCFVIFDQVSKEFIFTANFNTCQNIGKVIPGILSLCYVKNTGGAWGIFQNCTVILSIFSIIIITFLILNIFVFNKNSNYFLYYGSILICAGGIGNLVDRMLRGYVIDFLKFDFVNFPIFNLADSYLTVGFCLVVISLFIKCKSKQVSYKQ